MRNLIIVAALLGVSRPALGLEQSYNVDNYVAEQAVLRALTKLGFEINIHEEYDKIVITTNYLTSHSIDKYVNKSNQANGKYSINVNIKKNKDNRSILSINAYYEMSEGADKWKKLDSNGELEKELINDIEKVIEKLKSLPCLY